VGHEKHLLVDGANVMHAWPELRPLLAHDRDAARARLTQALSAIHDAEAVRVTIVFDGRGDALAVERPSGQATFSQLYTPAGVTADDVIERLVGQAADPRSCFVATNDRAERQTIAALGAAALSADDLAAWVERATQRQSGRVGELRRANERAWRKGQP
jgi:uncharacterized protein